ncbi:hypothetical protein, partial [Nonomuraea sp. NPDC049709]|uniref:hypothetical protein n=1 Tax=Nonomuraea sp. NPDC049709 TaxID=3154736 RepID=UPI003413E6AA
VVALCPPGPAPPAVALALLEEGNTPTPRGGTLRGRACFAPTAGWELGAPWLPACGDVHAAGRGGAGRSGGGRVGVCCGLRGGCGAVSPTG